MMRVAPFLLMLLMISARAPAQESASYWVTDQSFNGGGRLQLTSSSYQITLSNLGSDVEPTQVMSPSYQVAGGFAAGYPAPGEVASLLFLDSITLAWSPEPSAGDYNLYRAALGSLDLLDYGDCVQQNIAATTATDNDPVPAAAGFFYLVTVQNRLGEEGTKGVDSSGSVREGSVCP